MARSPVKREEIEEKPKVKTENGAGTSSAATAAEVLAAATLADATSTTAPEVEKPIKLPPDPSEWTVDHVLHHIKQVDPALHVHSETFRKHVSMTP